MGHGTAGLAGTAGSDVSPEDEDQPDEDGPELVEVDDEEPSLW